MRYNFHIKNSLFDCFSHKRVQRKRKFPQFAFALSDFSRGNKISSQINRAIHFLWQIILILCSWTPSQVASRYEGGWCYLKVGSIPSKTNPEKISSEKATESSRPQNYSISSLKSLLAVDHLKWRFRWSHKRKLTLTELTFPPSHSIFAADFPQHSKNNSLKNVERKSAC